MGVQSNKMMKLVKAARDLACLNHLHGNWQPDLIKAGDVGLFLGTFSFRQTTENSSYEVFHVLTRYGLLMVCSLDGDEWETI